MKGFLLPLYYCNVLALSLFPGSPMSHFPFPLHLLQANPLEDGSLLLRTVYTRFNLLVFL